MARLNTAVFSEQGHHDTLNFCAGESDLADRATEDAFWSYRYSSHDERAGLWKRIADEIDARSARINWIGTGKPACPKRGWTTGPLRMFDTHIRDATLPGRQPLPHPVLRMIQRPIGPVAVFGVTSFPLALSIAGGDAIAGCPRCSGGTAPIPAPPQGDRCRNRGLRHASRRLLDDPKDYRQVGHPRGDHALGPVSRGDPRGVVPARTCHLSPSCRQRRRSAARY